MITMRADIKGDIELRDKLGRYMSKLPRSLDITLKNVAKLYENALKEEIALRASKGGELWHLGALYESIKAQCIKKGRRPVYQIPMKIYGHYLEHMAKHVVSPYLHPELMEWIIAKWDDTRKIPPLIEVKPHPWMRRPLNNARKKIRSELQNCDVIRTTRESFGR